MSNKRICWENYFMKIADLSSIRSPCERLKVGCVIVKNNRILTIGYNGFLSGKKHVSIIKNNHEQATIHAEINAICDASKRGVSIDKSDAYITHYPCLNCYKALASSGIKCIYYQDDYKNDEIIPQLNYNIPIIKIES